MRLPVVAALVLFIVFSTWSGVPTGERALIFWIGVGVLVIMLVAFGLVIWHLLLRNCLKNDNTPNWRSN